MRLNTRISREDGVWAVLRFDAQGGYVPGIGPAGVWYAEHGAPYFPETATAPVLIQHRDRKRVERAIRNWLTNADSE